ncbi:MAG: hypothetical protein KJ833_02820, partial [Alphaproteobacteria bacterium]|nr:hypothetical protein [Alphaproteobacteria bacterium]
RTRTCRLFLDEAGEMHLAGIHSRESLRHFASWANISRATTFVEIDSHRSQWLNFPVWSIEIGSAERPTKVWSSSH